MWCSKCGSDKHLAGQCLSNMPKKDSRSVGEKDETRNCDVCGGPIDEHGLCFECDKPVVVTISQDEYDKLKRSARAPCVRCEAKRKRDRDRLREIRAHA